MSYFNAINDEFNHVKKNHADKSSKMNELIQKQEFESGELNKKID